jgi:hypothetical protein
MDKKLDDLIVDIRDDIDNSTGENKSYLESILAYLLELKISQERITVLSSIILEFMKRKRL